MRLSSLYELRSIKTMRFAKPFRRVVTALAGSLLIVACSQAAEQTGTADVHAAETAAGSLDELMAAGKGIYEANCGACHQPGGKGLPELADIGNAVEQTKHL